MRMTHGSVATGLDPVAEPPRVDGQEADDQEVGEDDDRGVAVAPHRVDVAADCPPVQVPARPLLSRRQLSDYEMYKSRW